MTQGLPNLSRLTLATPTGCGSGWNSRKRPANPAPPARRQRRPEVSGTTVPDNPPSVAELKKLERSNLFKVEIRDTLGGIHRGLRMNTLGNQIMVMLQDLKGALTGQYDEAISNRLPGYIPDGGKTLPSLINLPAAWGALDVHFTDLLTKLRALSPDANDLNIKTKALETVTFVHDNVVKVMKDMWEGCPKTINRDNTFYAPMLERALKTVDHAIQNVGAAMHPQRVAAGPSGGGEKVSFDSDSDNDS